MEAIYSILCSIVTRARVLKGSDAPLIGRMRDTSTTKCLRLYLAACVQIDLGRRLKRRPPNEIQAFRLQPAFSFIALSPFHIGFVEEKDCASGFFIPATARFGVGASRIIDICYESGTYNTLFEFTSADSRPRYCDRATQTRCHRIGETACRQCYSISPGT